MLLFRLNIAESSP